jgi:magnesium-transporting ATPase (P-type)
MTDPTPPHRWFRFSLRTLFVLVTVFCVILAAGVAYAAWYRRYKAWEREQLSNCDVSASDVPTGLPATR